MVRSFDLAHDAWKPGYPLAHIALAMRVDDDITTHLDFDDYDDDGLNVFYLVSITFAIGIWFVFYRYQSMRNRAVPFRVRAPEVRLGLLVMSTST